MIELPLLQKVILRGLDRGIGGASCSLPHAEVCLKHKVVLGHPHVTAKNHERVLKEGFRFLMSAPQRSFGVVGQAREMAGY